MAGTTTTKVEERRREVWKGINKNGSIMSCVGAGGHVAIMVPSCIYHHISVPTR